MKIKLWITIGVLIGATIAAQAQDQPKRQRPKGPPPEILKQFDKDGDGKLSEEERAEMRKAHEARMEERRREMLEKFDTDNDGKLNPEEREKAREAGKAKMLEKYDKDGDGKLSEEERAAMPKRPGGHRPGGRRGPGPQGPPPAEE